MNATTLERPDVAAYLAAVRSELADLPAEEREELLADVEASLVDAGEPPRLSPADFAAELREAAGLEPTAAPSADTSSTFDRLRAWLASDRAVALRATAHELEPIWWLLRAYAAVAAGALLLGLGWPIGMGTSGNGVRLGESLFLVVLATIASVWLGLRARRAGTGRRRLVAAANVALALVLLPVVVHSFEQASYQRFSPYSVAEPTPGLAVDGVQLTNLYPYTRDGRLLLDVLLYDESGRPVEIFPGAEDPLRRVLVGADGSRFFNSFPIRYFEPDTTTVAEPELGPAVAVPEIVTPPLERDPR